MEYRKHYNLLIEKARGAEKVEGEYYENHHILPRSLGGTDDKSNLVYLTARQHFLAHWLLFKMASNERELMKLGMAFGMMRRGNQCRQIANLTGKQYEAARKAMSVAQSIKMKGTTLATSEHRRKTAYQSGLTLASKEEFHFYHKDYGEFYGIPYELTVKYPDQKLVGGNLLKVGRGVWQSSNGWILFENLNRYDELVSLRNQKGAAIGGKIGGKMKHVNNGVERTRVHEACVNEFLASNPGWQLGCPQPKRGSLGKRHHHPTKKFQVAVVGSERSKALLEQGYYLK